MLWVGGEAVEITMGEETEEEKELSRLLIMMQLQGSRVADLVQKTELTPDQQAEVAQQVCKMRKAALDLMWLLANVAEPKSEEEREATELERWFAPTSQRSQCSGNRRITVLMPATI